MYNLIDESFKHGENFEIGNFCIIGKNVEVGDNVRIDDYVKICDNCRIGDGCWIRDYARLSPETVIGNNTRVGRFVKSSGKNQIGSDVVLRYDAIIARGTIVHDNVFISPQFMTENVSHKGKQIGGAEIGVGEWDKKKAEYRVFIGTNVTLASGIKISSNTIIGSKANVRKNILKPGVYVGNPAKLMRRL